MEKTEIKNTENIEKSISLFTQKAGEGKAHTYRNFLYLVAQPFLFSTDLLYKLWVNFKGYKAKKSAEQVDYLVVSDLILSGLCRPIGSDLYRMEEHIRTYLLEQDPQRPQREKDNLNCIIAQVAKFVEQYALRHKSQLSPNIYEIHSLYAKSILNFQALEKEIGKKLKNQDLQGYEKLGYLNLYFNALPLDENGSQQAGISVRLVENEESENVIRVRSLPEGVKRNLQKNEIEQMVDNSKPKTIEVVPNRLQLLPLYENEEFDKIEEITSRVPLRGSGSRGLGLLNSVTRHNLEKIPTPIPSQLKGALYKIVYKSPEIKQLAFTNIDFENTEKITLPTNTIKLELNGILLDDSIFKIAGLPDLISLKLSNMQLKELSFFEYAKGGKEKFEKLERLDLSNNQLTYFDNQYLELMPNLKELYLYGNPIQNIPQEIFNQQKENVLAEVKDYLLSIQENEKMLNEAKLIFVGVGEVGKSELVDALSKETYTFDENRPTTKGIRVKPWKPTNCQRDGEIIDFTANIWDFAGQEINYGTHQYFLTKNSVYIFVWDSRKEESSDFYYWLNIIKLLSDESPVFVVQNKIDIYQTEINQGNWKNTFPNIEGFYQTSCKTGEGIVDLRQAVIEKLISLDSTRELWSKNCFEIRKELEQSTQDYISYQAYRRLCEAKNLTKAQADFFGQQLHDIGVILHFRQDMNLKGTVVLNTEWANRASYILLNSDTIQKGQFQDSDLEDIWDEARFDGKHAFLLHLMRRFKLVFQFKNTQNYIIPRLLPIQAKSFDKKIDKTQKYLRFQYHYDFMPKDVLSQFICSVHEIIREDLFWRYGVVLEYENETFAEVLLNNIDRMKVISMKIWGREADKLLVIIRQEFDSIHQKLNHPDFTEKIPCICSECKNSKNPHLYDYAVLKKYNTKNITHIRCEKSLEEVPVISLLEGIIETNDSNVRYLYKMIEENEIADFFERLADLEVSENQIAELRQEYIASGDDFRYSQRLKVWVMDYFDDINQKQTIFGSSPEDAKKIIQEAKEKELTNIDLGKLDLTSLEEIPELFELRQLESIKLSDNKIKDISGLKDLENLIYLDLRHNKIENISALAKLRNLKEIDLSVNQIQNIESLGSLNNLEELYLRSNQVQNIQALKNLHNLKVLDLRRNNIQSFDPDILKSLNNLEKLKLYKNPIDNIPKEIFDEEFKNVFSAIKAYFKTEKQSILGSSPEDAKKIIQEAKEKELTSIDLGNLGLTSLEEIPELFELKQLEVLQLSASYYDWDNDIWIKSKNTGENNQIKNTPTKLNDNLRHLRKLYFRDIGLENILFLLQRFKNKRLKVLDLSDNPFKNPFPILGGIKVNQVLALEEFYLSNADLSDFSSKYFRNNLDDTLKKLDLSKVKNLKAKDLENILKKFTKLEKLNLSHNTLTNKNIDFLKGKETLLSLDLRHNQLTNFSQDFLASLPNLQALYLFGNPIKNLPQEILAEDRNCLEDLKAYFS